MKSDYHRPPESPLADSRSNGANDSVSILARKCGFSSDSGTSDSPEDSFTVSTSGDERGELMLFAAFLMVAKALLRKGWCIGRGVRKTPSKSQTISNRYSSMKESFINHRLHTSDNKDSGPSQNGLVDIVRRNKKSSSHSFTGEIEATTAKHACHEHKLLRVEVKLEEIASASSTPAT